MSLYLCILKLYHARPCAHARLCMLFLNGMIRKLKARFCARGDNQMEGVDLFETFSPVCNWKTVRIMLLISLIYDFATLQVDYTAAFTQSDIDKPPNWDSMTPKEKERSGVYRELSKGFKQAGKVLILNKSLYCLRQSPRNWFLHLKRNSHKLVSSRANMMPVCLYLIE
jgi:hypothetical protein